MPYILKTERENLADVGVDTLGKYLSRQDIKTFAGYLNYINFYIVKRWIEKNGKKYFVFATIVGTLVCCILEIYRKLIAPYEELKEEQNGKIMQRKMYR